MIGRLGERAGASFQNYKTHLRKCLYLTEPCFFTWPPRWLANRVSPDKRADLTSGMDPKPAVRQRDLPGVARPCKG
jgi:hypothetical protein